MPYNGSEWFGIVVVMDWIVNIRKVLNPDLIVEISLRF